MVNLISLVSQSLDGIRDLKAEEPFEVSSESIARLLVKTGRARKATDEPEKKNKYKRRDMRAED